MKKYTKHIPVLLLFIAISFTYFNPILQRQALDAHDAKTWKGISKEVRDFRESTGEEALWTNSLFSGMPAYLVSTQYPSNLIKYVSKTIQLGIPRPANLLWLYLLGFYILLVSMKIDYRISAIGAIAFAFSSYFFIIIQAGHMTKAHAIAYMPMVIASVLYTYRGNMLLGGALTALTVALEIYANHLQITYYLFLIILLIVLTQFVKNLKRKSLSEFFKRSAVLLMAAILASGTSITKLMTTIEYGKYSIRGKSELTDNQNNKTSGLDKDYATQWSYGVFETMTLLVPNIYGGASEGSLSKNSETYNKFIDRRIAKPKENIKKLPLYWGDQPVTSGPTYAGSIVIFLFIIGIFIVKPTMRRWLLLATIMSIMLAWGKNFMWLTNLFLEYFPGYNKFRAVSMILVIAEFTIPLLGFLALHQFLKEDDQNPEKSKIQKSRILRVSFFITCSLLAISILFGVMSDFIGSNDHRMQDWLADALQKDRRNLLFKDVFRSLFFISITYGILRMYLSKKLLKEYLFIAIGVLILTDMWTVNKRYLNDSHFIKERKLRVVYSPNDADRIIEQDKDLSFRVFNKSVNTFNDASTSYRHSSIGGYHGAKIRRYQDLIEKHIQKQYAEGYLVHNVDVLSMLNTKWIINNPQQPMLADGGFYLLPIEAKKIVKGDLIREVSYEGKKYLSVPFKKPLGNAWFIQDYKLVENADQEINELSQSFNRGISKFQNWAVINSNFSDFLIPKENLDNKNSKIVLKEYKPNYLKYESNANFESIAVFSEIYYEKGWKAFIDGEEFPHFRANYILRAMKIPAGKHIVEFKFEPQSYYQGERISLISSILLLSILAFAGFKELKALKE